jgi:hypothetical protein
MQMKNWRILKFILYKIVPMALWLVKFHETPHIAARRLGSVAGPVIQATGRSEFEDGLGSGDFVSGYSYHMSVRTRLSDHTKQTKFQSQRPSMLKHLFPLFWVQKCSNIGTVSTWMGDRLEWYPHSRKMLIAAVAPRWCRHREEMI